MDREGEFGVSVSVPFRRVLSDPLGDKGGLYDILLV